MTNRVVVNRAVVVRSVNGAEVTVIQGYFDPLHKIGDAAIRCVYLTNGATLSGFTLTNGATRGSFTGDQQRERSGGGVWCESTDAVVTDCTISGNRADAGGSGAYRGSLCKCRLVGNIGGDGAAVAYGLLASCSIISNYAGGDGGGAYSSTLNNCILIGNRTGPFVQGSAGRPYGGGAYGSTLNNCTLTGNWGDGEGRGAYASTLNNCIAFYNLGSDPGCANSTLNNCWTTDPLFVDRLNGDLHLQSTSPCINAGSNSYVANATDLAGNPRIAYGTVDIGAYEWSAPALSGSVALEGFAGPARNGTGNRWVSFKASDDSGTVLAAWDRELSFAGGADGGGVAGYTLTNLPPGTTRLSAKTAWHLRKRLPVALTNGQVVAHFAGPSALPAGDLDGSNLVDIGDYFLMAASWYQPDAVADLDGSGLVDVEDYFLLSNHWYEQGDPE